MWHLAYLCQQQSAVDAVICILLQLHVAIKLSACHSVRLPCRQAGRWQESARILQQLTDNAVTQHQYSLAASLRYQLAMEALDEVWTKLLPSISAATC